MTISVIIPTFNEADSIGKLVKYLLKHGGDRVEEVIVVDGGSSDKTLEKARNSQAKTFFSKKKGRACQMNFGAEQAKGEVLYFVHADSWPPKSFAHDIEEAIFGDYEIGCYRFKFNSNRPILRINSYCTRFDRLMCRGGDQTLFVSKSLFQKVGGYKEWMIMEEYDFIIRARKQASFKIIPKDVLVSARKYEKNSYFRVNLANFVVFMMFYMGCSQDKMLSTYKSMIQHAKL